MEIGRKGKRKCAIPSQPARKFAGSEYREAFGVRAACCRCRTLRPVQKRQQAARTYSPSKVIHGWRGEPFANSPQPTVNNFGGGAKMLHQQLLFLLNREVGHAGPGRRIPHSNVATFVWRHSLRALRLVVKEYSEPFACKCKLAETNSYKSFPAARPACLA